MEHIKQAFFVCGSSSRFNIREELSYYGFKGSSLFDVNDDNIRNVEAFEGVLHKLEVQGRG